MVIVTTCGKIEYMPKVLTGTISSITLESARAEGNLIDVGGGIHQHGHCWSTSPNTDVSDSKTSLGLKASTGLFTSSLTGLHPETKYYVRAYAQSGIEIIYGEEISFTTGQSNVTDGDGIVYDVIQIGTQLWMKENLKTTKFNDGTNIPLVTDNSDWSDLTTPGYCCYDNDDATYKDMYGALYNYYAVTSGKLCPAGWHVPTDYEWVILTDYLGGELVAGGKLKQSGTDYWNSPNYSATNETGFTALPGGIRNNDGSFSEIKDHGYWWSHTESSIIYAYCREMNTYGGIHRYTKRINCGLSVRCVRD